ncbi:MAG: SIS domain-containing protein [Clostridia bacterium]|nr:SIS domain-containing protein [Clostridia bacterium]
MLKFDEQEQIASVRGALALRPQIEEIVDAAWDAGVKNLCWLGIGGTWASAMQAVCHMKERSALEVFSINAAEYLTTGDRRIGKGTFLVFSSVTGTTSEIVQAVEKAKVAGAKVLGFVDTEGTLLAKAADICIHYPKNEQLKFFMVADRFLCREGVLAEYEAMYAQFDRALPEALAGVEKAADAFGAAFAERHMNDKLHYFVGAGALYGSTYSYAMCYWEEMHWMRTKSIHAAEFFHGMLEIVDEDTPVTVFVGEDSQRTLSERVVRFLKKVNRNFTVIDSRDYALPGIDDVYRYGVSHLVTHAVTNRIDAHLEALSGHDMEIRRYYRKVEY